MMNNILEAIPGVFYHMDNVQVYGKDNQEHDKCLTSVLERIKAAGITLNPKFARSSLTFLGHLIKHFPRSSQNISNQTYATTQEYHRTPKVLENGEPAGGIFPKYLWNIDTPTATTARLACCLVVPGYGDQTKQNHIDSYKMN